MIEKNFRSRMSHVSYYLRALRELEGSHKISSRGFYRAAETIAVSRAAAFIMIYNCVEYATRESLIDLRESIEKSSLDYTQINDYWQREIIHYAFYEKLSNGINNDNMIREIHSFIPVKIQWNNNIRRLPFSGNIDHDKLIKFAQSIGGNKWRPPAGTLGGSDLLTVRTKRNGLAHGDETFEDVGASFSAQDIQDKIGRIRKFMCSYLRMIERYKKTSLYKKL